MIYGENINIVYVIVNTDYYPDLAITGQPDRFTKIRIPKKAPLAMNNFLRTTGTVFTFKQIKDYKI